MSNSITTSMNFIPSLGGEVHSSQTSGVTEKASLSEDALTMIFSFMPASSLKRLAPISSKRTIMAIAQTTHERRSTVREALMAILLPLRRMKCMEQVNNLEAMVSSDLFTNPNAAFTHVSDRDIKHELMKVLGTLDQKDRLVFINHLRSVDQKSLDKLGITQVDIVKILLSGTRHGRDYWSYFPGVYNSKTWIVKRIAMDFVKEGKYDIAVEVAYSSSNRETIGYTGVSVRDSTVAAIIKDLLRRDFDYDQIIKFIEGLPNKQGQGVAYREMALHSLTLKDYYYAKVFFERIDEGSPGAKSLVLYAMRMALPVQKWFL